MIDELQMGSAAAVRGRAGSGRRHAWVGLVACLLLVMTACGGGGAAETSEESATDTGGDAAAGTEAAAPDDGAAAGATEASGAGGSVTPDGSVEPLADYPQGDITMLIPYDAGGGGDAYARALAEAMGELVPQGVNVVPENRPPAVEALSTLWSAEPDGYMIGYMPMPATVGLQLEQPDIVPWETTEFPVLGIIESNGYVLYVAGDSEYETLEDLQNAEGLSTLQTDPGSGSALAAGAAIVGLGLDAESTYGAETSAEISTALIRGDIDFTTHGVTDYPGAVESGEVRPLLFLGTEEQRTEGVEWVQDLQDWEDVGRPDLKGAVSEFRVFSTPPGIPDDRLAYLRELFWEAANGETMQQWSEETGRPLLPQDAQAAEQIVQEQTAAMEELIPVIGQSAQ